MENLISNHTRNLNINHVDPRHNLGLRKQRRPIRNDLFNFRTAAGKAGHARWSSQHQRGNLLRESLYSRAVFAADADAQLYLRQIRRRFTGKWSMRSVRADELRQNFIKPQPKPIETRPEYLVGGLRFVVRLRPGVDQCSDSFVSGRVAD